MRPTRLPGATGSRAGLAPFSGTARVFKKIRAERLMFSASEAARPVANIFSQRLKTPPLPLYRANTLRFYGPLRPCAEEIRMQTACAAHARPYGCCRHRRALRIPVAVRWALARTNASAFNVKLLAFCTVPGRFYAMSIPLSARHGRFAGKQAAQPARFPSVPCRKGSGLSLIHIYMCIRDRSQALHPA